MPCHILCPSCGNGIGEVFKFIKLAEQGYYKSLKDTPLGSVNPDKIELIPNIALPIGFILDAAGLKLMCCRMHVLGVTDFNNIHKK